MEQSPSPQQTERKLLHQVNALLWERIELEKRSRSVTPDCLNSTSKIIQGIERKLMSTERISPRELLKRSIERQKKAERLRSEMEGKKLQAAQKVAERHQLAKERYAGMQAEKYAKLIEQTSSKMDKAEERYEERINRVRSKAKQEKEKADENAFFFMMSKSNKKIDMNNKMNETIERKKNILELTKQKQTERAQKEEAANKRRQTRQEESKNKFIDQQKKLRTAHERRKKMLEEKKKAAGATKIEEVAQRKKQIEDKIIDLMQFLSNKKSVWDYLVETIEEEDEDYTEDLTIFNAKTHFERVKLKLRKDAEKLNKLIKITENGEVIINRSEMQKSFDADLDDSNISKRPSAAKYASELSNTDTSDSEVSDLEKLMKKEEDDKVEELNAASQQKTDPKKSVGKGNYNKGKKSGKRKGRTTAKEPNQKPDESEAEKQKASQALQAIQTATEKQNSKDGSGTRMRKRKSLSKTSPSTQSLPNLKEPNFNNKQQKVLLRLGKNGRFCNTKIIITEDVSFENAENPSENIDNALESIDNIVESPSLELSTISESVKLKEDGSKSHASPISTPTKKSETSSLYSGASPNHADITTSAEVLLTTSGELQITNSNEQECPHINLSPLEIRPFATPPTQKDTKDLKEIKKAAIPIKSWNRNKSGSSIMKDEGKSGSGNATKETPKKKSIGGTYKKSSSSVVSKNEEEVKDDPELKKELIKNISKNFVDPKKDQEESQTIIVEDEKLIEALEKQELVIRWCKLCNFILPDDVDSQTHLQSRIHKKAREEFQVSQQEDSSSSIMKFCCVPGDVNQELQKEREISMKKRCKKIKQQLLVKSWSHELAVTYFKDMTTVNKKRLLQLCVTLERFVIPHIKDYPAVEATLKEILKILDMKVEGDLHLIRRVKFISILIEICKRTAVCPKNEIKNLGEVLEYVIKIINIFCGLRENRFYLIATNRVVPLTELLLFWLSKPAKLICGISFLPQLFYILTLTIKQTVPYSYQGFKEDILEYLICTGIGAKIKQKFQVFAGPLDLTTSMGFIPNLIIKGICFLDTLLSGIAIDSRSRPVYEKSAKVSENAYFLLESTEIFGVLPLITEILLSKGQMKLNQAAMASASIPQTIISLVICGVKAINSAFRVDLQLVQTILLNTYNREQMYHLINLVLAYTTENIDMSDDNKELLHEVIVMIGYYTLLREDAQSIMSKGENTILQKLCNLPGPYFIDKKLKELLFPTLICVCFNNERNLAILDQDLDTELLVKFIQTQTIISIEEENEDDPRSLNKGRSPSVSSATSSNYSINIDIVNCFSPFVPFIMRFPRKLWPEAIKFFSQRDKA